MKESWKNRREGGDFIEWLLMLLALSVVIFAILVPKTSPQSFIGFNTGLPSVGFGGETVGTDSLEGEIVYGPLTGSAAKPTSAYRHQIQIGPGSAANEYSPNQEYVSVRNAGATAVNITGWKLKNAKDRRPVEVGGELRYYESDTAVIPKAATLLQPAGNNVQSDVVLAPGETAILTTGQIGVTRPYRITSFKVNKCSGYLGTLPRSYSFNPGISRQCPSILAGQSSAVTPECRDFIERMPSCHNPDIGSVVNGDECRNCVDDIKLPSSCVEFIEENQGYAACVAKHVGDQNFYGNEWRIFLGRNFEMWAERYETIELYDNFGQLVASYSY